MKRFVAYILFVCCITLLLSGCKQPPVDGPDHNTSGQAETTTNGAEQAVNNTETTGSTEETVNNTESVKAEDIEGPLAQYVQTAVKETLTSVNDYGQTTQIISLRIPKLLPFSADATAAQAEIQSKFDPKLAELREEISKGFTSYTHSIDYSAYLNGSVLSVVIQNRSTIDLINYYVYNFDIETGKRLDNEALMHKLQITDFTEKFTQIAKNAFEAKWGTSSGTQDTLYTTQKVKNISQENISKAMPYVAEDGKIMVILNIYSLAGAEYYPEVFPLSD